MDAKCWVTLGTVGSAQSSQQGILGLVRHIFVVLCSGAELCRQARERLVFACLLVGQDESLATLQHLAPQGCKGHFLAFSPGTLTASQTIRMPSVHPAHVNAVQTGMGAGSPASLPACRKLLYWCAKPALKLSSSLDTWTDMLGEGTPNSH